MLVIFIGPPGSGKGTQAKQLSEYLGVPHLSTGDMFRAAIDAGTKTGQEAAQYINQGKLVPDDIVVQLVNDRLAEDDCQGGCLLDGFPRTVSQAETLDKFLDAANRSVDLVIELCVFEDELIRRMLKRAETEGRADDTPETIQERLRVYAEQTIPVLEYYQNQNIVDTVDGTGTPEEVFERLQDCVKERDKE